MDYEHLTISERTVISQLKVSGYSARQIARQIDRSPSTISRELKRNSYLTGKNYGIRRYNPVFAQKRYDGNKRRCGRKKIDDRETLEYIREKIEQHWSPEQICGRKEKDVSLPSVSTIYRMIHERRLGAIHMTKLRRKGKFKRPAEKRGKFNDGGRAIRKRPKEVYKRQTIGHWEGDTVVSGKDDRRSKSKVCFVTLAERKSRFYLAVKVPDRSSESVTKAIIDTLKDFPEELVKTITFDRGKEFSGYEEIEKELGCSTYFCDPYCSWQKGTNENGNGLLREFFPKGMDLSEAEENELNHCLRLINQRPRKCLGFKTPLEVIQEDIGVALNLTI